MPSNNTVENDVPVIIRLSDLYFGYLNRPDILKGICFELRKDDNVGLTGYNGSGKSTLLQLMVGVLEKKSGVIEIFGRRCERERDFIPVRERVGLLFQDADDQLFCPTVMDDIAFGPLNLGKRPDEARRIVRQTLELLDMQGFEDRVTHRLSGGEKKIISLGTLIAMDPDVLLLDEPVNGLDERSRARVIEILNRLPQAKIIVSHDEDLLARITSRDYRLEDGRLHLLS